MHLPQFLLADAGSGAVMYLLSALASQGARECRTMRLPALLRRSHYINVAFASHNASPSIQAGIARSTHLSIKRAGHSFPGAKALVAFRVALPALSPPAALAFPHQLATRLTGASENSRTPANKCRAPEKNKTLPRRRPSAITTIVSRSALSLLALSVELRI